MPIVWDTVADGLACGKRTFGGCCANASEVAAAMMEIEMSNTETRLIEVIFVFPPTAKCGAHYKRVAESWKWRRE